MGSHSASITTTLEKYAETEDAAIEMMWKGAASSYGTTYGSGKEASENREGVV